MVVTSLDGNVTMRNQSVPFLGLETAPLEQMARESGARQVKFFGDYQSTPYDRSASVDLIMVARK